LVAVTALPHQRLNPIKVLYHTTNNS